MPLLLLFDIDGTLLRAGDPVHAEAMRLALYEFVGEPVALDGIPLAGMLDRQIARLALLRHGLDNETIERLLPEILQQTGKHYAERVRRGDRRSWVLPGVRDLLPRLWQQGHLAGVLTGNTELVARTKLAAADLDQLLPFGAYGDQAEERHVLVARARLTVKIRYGLDIPLAQTILVGDTPRDVAAALESGAKVLAVTTGRFGPEELRTAGASTVLPDLADVDRVLATVHELATGS